jgi:hypothetical protein
VLSMLLQTRQLINGSRPAEPVAEADRGRHPGFPSFNVLAGGPGSLALPFGGVRDAAATRFSLMDSAIAGLRAWCPDR